MKRLFPFARRVRKWVLLSAAALALQGSGILGALPARAAAPAYLWSQRFGSTSTDIGHSVAADASGNLFVTGYFQGSVDFGGGVLISAGATQDIFLAKYNSTGVHQWSQRFGSSGSDQGLAIAVDGSGNVYLTGRFDGTVNFGGGPLVSAGLTDIFVAAYNSAGAHQWSLRFGGANVDLGNDIDVDLSGNVIVTGQFNDAVDFGGGLLTSAGGSDIFVAAYNSAGVHQWSRRFGDTGTDTGNGVAVGSTGNAVITGQFNNAVDFGGGLLTSAGGSDIFVAAYNSAGVHQWSQRFGSTSSDAGNDIAVDPAGNAIVTGSFAGTVDFGGGPLVAVATDIFLAKYNSTGTHEWSRRFGGTSSDTGDDLAVDTYGSVYITGRFDSNVDFGGGPLVSAGASDIYVVKFNSAGTHQFSQRFGSTNPDLGRGITVDPTGSVTITGNFDGTVDFGGGGLVSSGTDIFLASYARGEPVITSIADIGNDQGRKVKIRFFRSGHDAPVSQAPVTGYEAYRRDDAPPVSFALPQLPSGLSPAQLLDAGWTHVATVAAHGQTSYGIDAPTVGDSTVVLGQYRSVFFIRAATDVPTTFFDSSPDSGYSLDNLSPSVPTNFVYNTGTLTWDESPAADFDYFTVYGSNSDVFATAILVDYTVAPTLNVNAAPYTFYFVTATDFSGNEGKHALANALTGVGGSPKRYVLSVSNYPNPFNPGTTVSYTVPAKGRVTMAIYDARGARVTTLVDNEERDAGPYRVDWNGRSDTGLAVSSGVYFARIEQAGAMRSKKMVLLK